MSHAGADLLMPGRSDLVEGYNYLEEHCESVFLDLNYLRSHYWFSEDGGRDADGQVGAVEEEAGAVVAALRDYMSNNPPAPIQIKTSPTACWTEIFQDVSFSTFPTIAQLKQVDVVVGDRRAALDSSTYWEYMTGVLHLSPTPAAPRPGVLSGGPTKNVSLLAAMPDSTLVGVPVYDYCRGAVGDSGLLRQGTQCWRLVVGALDGYNFPFNAARGVDIKYLMRTYPHPHFDNPNYRVFVTKQTKYTSHITLVQPGIAGSLSLQEFFEVIDENHIYL